MYARYTVEFIRDPADDFQEAAGHPTGHDGSDAAAIEQLRLEIAEAIQSLFDTGSIAGHFKVIGREMVTEYEFSS